MKNAYLSTVTVVHVLCLNEPDSLGSAGLCCVAVR